MNEVTNGDGLKTLYQRGTGNVVTIANYDGSTLLTKFVNTPVSALGVGRSKYHDYYLDATTFERWEYVYNVDNLLAELVPPTTKGHRKTQLTDVIGKSTHEFYDAVVAYERA